MRSQTAVVPPSTINSIPLTSLESSGAAGESLGQVSGLGLIAADDLDGIAARYRQRADGAGHVPGADDADVAHEVSRPD
jgi:hypothetical protein